MPNLGITASGYALAAVLFWLLLGAKETIGELVADVEAQAEETQEAVDANTSNMTTIRALEGRIAAMLDERKAEQQERDRVLAERERALSIARRDAAVAKRDRDRLLRSTKSCENYADIVAADVCPAIAERLRIRSENPGSDGDGSGDGTGGSVPAPTGFAD